LVCIHRVPLLALIAATALTAGCSSAPPDRAPIERAKLEEPSVTLEGGYVVKRVGGGEPSADRAVQPAGALNLPRATIYEIDWGNVDPDVMTNMPHFYGDFAGSGYAQSIGQFDFGGAGGNVIYGGQYQVTSPSAPPIVGDGDVQKLVFGMSAVAANDPDAIIFVVHLPPGVTATDNTGTSNCANTTHTLGWCGYHHYTGPFSPAPGGGLRSIYYAVLPDMTTGAGIFCGTSCDFTKAGMINNFTKTASHELIETLTDANGDQGNNEIGDICNSSPVDGGQGFTTMPARNGPPWFVQAPYSPHAGACIFYAPWVYAPPSHTGSGFAFARTPYHMDVFRSTSAGSVVSADWDISNGGPNHWQGLAGTLGNNVGVSWPNTPVSGIARYETHMDVFSAPASFGFPAQFPSQWWDSSVGWNTFEINDVYNNVNLPAPGLPLSVTARNADTMDVFYLSEGGEIMDVGYDTTHGWSPHAASSANLSEGSNGSTAKPVNLGAPTGISREWDLLDVFAVDGGGTIWGWEYSASAATPVWRGPFSITAAANGPKVSARTHIAAFSRNSNRIELFAVDDSGAVQSFVWNNTAWSFVNNVLPAGSTVPGAGIGVGGWGSHVDVVTTSKSKPGSLVVAWWDDYAPPTQSFHTWSNYQVGSGFTLGQPISVVTRYVHSLDVFGLQSNGSIEWLGYDGQGHWTGPQTVL
jgi:hypothetical protein